jgi:hypothetical protein
MEMAFLPESTDVLRRRASRARRLAAAAPDREIARRLRVLAREYETQADATQPDRIGTAAE